MSELFGTKWCNNSITFRRNQKYVSIMRRVVKQKTNSDKWVLRYIFQLFDNCSHKRKIASPCSSRFIRNTVMSNHRKPQKMLQATTPIILNLNLSEKSNLKPCGVHIAPLTSVHRWWLLIILLPALNVTASLRCKKTKTANLLRSAVRGKHTKKLQLLMSYQKKVCGLLCKRGMRIWGRSWYK